MLVLPALLLAAAPHLPHDDVHGIAVAPLPNGATELVLAANPHAKFLRSVDGGLSWTTIAGQGLGFQQGHAAVYHDDPAAPQFFLATNGGVWTCASGSSEALAANAGLLSGDRSVSRITAPAAGAGPVLLATTRGNLYRWRGATRDWELVLQTGLTDAHAQVALVADYAAGDPPGPSRAAAAAVAGVLWWSRDGGATWTPHAQFSTPANGPGDWHLSALALSPTFAADGGLLLGRGREEAGSPTGTVGEIWLSEDHGQSFQLVRSTGSAVRALRSLPAGAGGPRRSLAALEAHPYSEGYPQQAGVLVSSDGVSWNDLGNAQDFSLDDEDDTGVPTDLFRRLDLVPSPHHALDGTVWLGRPSGLFRSRDAGRTWQQVDFRPPSHVRDLALATGPNGELHAFGACYGSGLLRVDVDPATAELLDGPISYGRSVETSAHFATDGAVGMSGEGGVALWYDTRRPPLSSTGRTGFLYERTWTNARALAFHPAFDQGVAAATNAAVMAWTFLTPASSFLSHDGGLHQHDISFAAGGGPAPYERRLAFAPTYDPNSLATVQDLYGLASAWLTRFGAAGWEPVTQAPGNLFSLVVAPSYSRPANPRVFVAELQAPVVHEVLDHPGGAVVNPLPTAGLEGQVRALALGSDFAQRPVVYATTWGTGVRRLDLAAANPVWEPVGGPFPAVWAEPIALPADFAGDRRVVVGTQDGVWVGRDQPGAPWVRVPAPYTVDDQASGVRYYSPAAAGNRHPERVWPWSWARRAEAPTGLREAVNGQTLRWTGEDGAYLERECRAREVRLRSFRGPSRGTARVELWSLDGATLLAAVDEDLAAATEEAWSVSLALPAAEGVLVRVTALLDPGESLLFDGLTVDAD